MIEFCCGEDSLMGSAAIAGPECHVIRVTRRNDVTTKQGSAFVDKALALAQQKVGQNVLVWASTPCTGGTPWTHLNALKGDQTRLKIAAHRREFRRIWASFVKSISPALTAGISVAIEWPQGCVYWQDKRVRGFLRQHRLIRNTFHGCMYGLCPSHSMTSDTQKYIKKPWSIATNNLNVWHALSKTCDKSHEHVRCQRNDTSLSERYTHQMCEAVHLAFASSVNAINRDDVLTGADYIRAHFAMPVVDISDIRPQSVAVSALSPKLEHGCGSSPAAKLCIVSPGSSPAARPSRRQESTMPSPQGGDMTAAGAKRGGAASAAAPPLHKARP
jgi:hypothetical protein